MTFGKFLIVPLGLALSACSLAQLGAVATLESGLSSIAARIDKGVPIGAHDLPAACRITADIARAARVLSETGTLGSEASDRLALAADAGAALVASDLCIDPARNPLALSIEIVKAVAAMRQAASGHSAVSAAAMVAGAGLTNR